MAPPSTRPGFGKMLLRGAFRRCPSCGGRGAFFTSWFAKADSCRTCGLYWRRDDVGYELGAAAIAAIIVMGPLVLVLGAVLITTYPDVPTGPLIAVFVPLAVILPVVLYPVSYTIWQAVDLLMRPPTADDYDPSVTSPDVPSVDADG